MDLSEYKIVLAGHSHLTALQFAFNARKNREATSLVEQIDFVQLLDKRFTPIFIEDDTPKLNPEVMDVLTNRSLGQKSSIFLAISGNEYHFMGMVNHPRPFDFVLSEVKELPLSCQAEVVPTAFVEQSLRGSMGNAVKILQGIRSAVAGPVFQFSSPPPIEDGDFLTQQKTVFSSQIEERGISPAPLRLKLWRLQQRLYKNVCDEIGIRFLEVPYEALDPNGFMTRRGWHPDGVHASPWYGELLLQQVECVLKHSQPEPARAV